MARPVRENTEKRLRRSDPSARDPRLEFANMLSRLGVSRESIKKEEEVIGTPDERTVITYDLEMDPQTGAHRKVTNFSTTERICELCDKYVPRVYECESEGCGALVCAKHRRRSPFEETTYVCLNCYEEDMKAYERAYGQQDNS